MGCLFKSSQKTRRWGLPCQLLQMRDLRLREVQELAQGHPAAKWKVTESNQLCRQPKPSGTCLQCAAFQKRAHTSTPPCKFCKTDRQTAQRLACQGE